MLLLRFRFDEDEKQNEERKLRNNSKILRLFLFTILLNNLKL